MSINRINNSALDSSVSRYKVVVNSNKVIFETDNYITAEMIFVNYVFSSGEHTIQVIEESSKIRLDKSNKVQKAA